jgi:hypothetical protein
MVDLPFVDLGSIGLALPTSCGASPWLLRFYQPDWFLLFLKYMKNSVVIWRSESAPK